jgi:hypothetical protein
VGAAWHPRQAGTGWLLTTVCNSIVLRKIHAAVGYKCFFSQLYLGVLQQVGLLNVDGYYNSLLSFIDKAVEEEFISPTARHIIVLAPTPNELLDKLEVTHLTDTTYATTRKLFSATDRYRWEADIWSCFITGVLPPARGGRAEDQVGDGAAELLQELRDPAGAQRRDADRPSTARNHACSELMVLVSYYYVLASDHLGFLSRPAQVVVM